MSEGEEEDGKKRTVALSLRMLVEVKTFWKIETANAIFWMYLGGTAKKIFFRNKTFLFFKIES